MSVDQEGNTRELRRISRLLKRTSRLAKEASMTGSLSQGKEYVIEQYNAIVADLAQRGLVLPAYFPPLTVDAPFDAAGIACAQLAEYIEADLPSEEEEQKGRGGGEKNVIIGNIGDLSQLGELIRNSLPKWMREAREGRAAREGQESASEGSGGQANPGNPTSLNDLESRLAELGAKIQVVAEQMRREELPPEEVQRLAGELSRLGREQAQMAQEAAEQRALGSQR